MEVSFQQIGGRANICTIYNEKGSKTDVCNYRYISLLSIVGKVAERWVYNNIIPVLGRDFSKAFDCVSHDLLIMN